MDIGDHLELEYVVAESDSARALSIAVTDDFPEVLATSRMIALMELAAARLMKPLLAQGELSVGVQVDISHLAATPIGTNVKAVAEYAGLMGKTHSFNVFLYDKGGLAGKGSHTRAIVNTDRLVEGASRRGLT